jgi:hypothetical protein
VRVRVRATQTVRYDQTIAMPLKEWKRIKAMEEDEAAAELVGWLDLANVDDADDIGGCDFDAFVVDKNDKPTGDIYGGM